MREADCDEDGIVDRALALRNTARAIGERNMATTDTCYRRSWARMRGVKAGVWLRIMLVCRKYESSRSGEISRDDSELKHAAACDSPKLAPCCYQQCLPTSNMILHHLHRELLNSLEITAKFETMHFCTLDSGVQLRSGRYLRHYIFCPIHIYLFQ
jgi:hypothetical protein